VPDPLVLGALIVAALALGIAVGALVTVLHTRTRVYALEQLQGLTTRRIRVIAEHVGIPLAVERRRNHRKIPSGIQDRRHPRTDGPVPEGLGGHPRIVLPVTPETAGDEQRLEPVEIIHRPPPPLRPSRVDE
jgi:hypothetical protein